MLVSRPLDHSDLWWITDELRELPKQSEYFADVPDDPEYVLSQLKAYFDAGILIGTVVMSANAFLLATVQRPWYANRVEVHEMMLWVPKAARGTLTGPLLIKSYIKLAKTYNPHSIHAGATLDIIEGSKVLDLYCRLGFTRDKLGVVMRP